MGLRFADHVEISAGVSLMLLKALSQPEWSNTKTIPDPTGSDGVGTYDQQSIAGSTIVVLTPGLGARYDF